MVPFESLGAVFYSSSIVTVAVSEIFSVKECRDLEIGAKGHSRSLEMVPFDRLYTSSYCCVFSNIMILLEVNEFKKVCNCHILTTVDVFCFHLIVSFRFYRAMLCKRGLCCHAVSVCLPVGLSVCLSVTFVDHVKTNKHIF